MDEVASNVSDRKRPKAPWPWGLVAGILLAVFILTSIAGLLVAIFGKKIIHPTISFYFQVVAGFFAFFLSISETGLLVSTVKWVESVKQEQVKLLRSSVLSASGRLRSIPNTIPEQPVRDFNAARILLVYISITGLNLGLLLGFLSLNLMFVYESHTSLRGELWPFFTVDVTLGLIVPLIIGVSLIPLAKTVRYVTNSQIETRKLFHWCLPCLNYRQGSKDCYWIIDDSYYMKIDRKRGTGLNTVLVYFLSLAVFLHSWLYFINSSITTQFGSSGCSLLSEKDKFHLQCFDLLSDFGNMIRINCSLNSSFDGPLFCLEFHGSNLIHAVVISIVLYYLTSTCISVVFQIVRGLLVYAQTGAWSNLVILLGILLLFFGCAAFVSNVFLQSNFDVLGFLQLLFLCTCIVIVGFLLKRGRPIFKTRKSSKDSIALTPVNPSEISVPLHEYHEIPIQLPEVRSLSLTTEEESVQQPLPAPPPVSSPSIHTLPQLAATRASPTDNSDTVSLPPSLPLNNGQDSIPAASFNTLQKAPKGAQQHHLQKGVLTNSQRRETAPALVNNKRKVTIL